jgi:hypothetical protein
METIYPIFLGLLIILIFYLLLNKNNKSKCNIICIKCNKDNLNNTCNII